MAWRVIGAFLLSCVCLLALAAPASAQSSIAGVVTDESGGVLPGVTVEAASPVLIEKVRSAVADAQGRYTITSLRPGDYAVTFSLAGFNTLKREGLSLPDNFTATVNSSLKVGRELEFADLFRFIKQQRIRPIVWITGDVHYTAAHYYDPHKAQFPDFDPFWEFVSGPLNAGSFGPNALDNTFGPQIMFQKAPAAANTPPAASLQFFGQVDIDGKTGEMTVTLKDLAGARLYVQRLVPNRA